MSFGKPREQMSKRYWLIQGHDSFESVFKMKVGIGEFTSDQIQDLLKALAAKTGLTFQEIVGAYAKRGTKIANDLLAVHHDFPTYMCGSNPTFTARIVDENDKLIPRPKLD
jgi:hypothetical protein